MRKELIKSLAIVGIGLLGSFQETLACSAFSFQKNGRVIVAKNYDWLFGHGHGAIFVYPRKTPRTAFNPNLKETDPFKWESTYGSVTFNQFGKGFPATGRNEKDLTIEALELAQAEYNGGESKRGVNEAQWAQYQLDMYASTAEVLEHLEELPVNKAYMGVHFLIADASGDTAVVEFLNGRVMAYHGESLKIPALTNNPYQELLDYHDSHPDEQCPASIWGARTSENRFCTIAKGLRNVSSKSDHEVYSALKILNAVRLNGSSHDARGEPTQWSLVHDLTDRSIYFETRDNPELRKIDLKKIDFSTLKTILVGDMNQSGEWDMTETLVPYTDEFNASLINKNHKLLWIKWALGWGWVDLNMVIEHGIQEAKQEL